MDGSGGCGGGGGIDVVRAYLPTCVEGVPGEMTPGTQWSCGGRAAGGAGYARPAAVADVDDGMARLREAGWVDWYGRTMPVAAAAP